MGHDEKHYPCQCKERKKVKTKEGFTLNCKSCGHTFKEVKTPFTISEDFLNREEQEG